MTGWWFGKWKKKTFHSVGNNTPNWRTHIFQRVETTNQYIYYNYWGTHVDPDFLSGVGSTPPIPGHWIFTHKAENFSRAVGFDALTSEHGDGSKWLTFKQMVSHTDWWMPKRLDCFSLNWGTVLQTLGFTIEKMRIFGWWSGVSSLGTPPLQMSVFRRWWSEFRGCSGWPFYWAAWSLAGWHSHSELENHHLG